MKRVLVLSIYVLCSAALTGCQQQAKSDMSAGTSDMSAGKMEVFIEGGGQFPEFLVGKWKGGNRELVFEPDGKISRARISMGEIDVTPGRITTVPTRGGGTIGIENGQVAFSSDLINAGDYEVRLFFDNSYDMEAKAGFKVGALSQSKDVSKSKEAVTSRDSQLTPSLKTSKAVYKKGESIVVDFSNLPGNRYDWIGLYDKDAPNDTHIDWTYSDGRIGGKAVFVPGDWSVRYSPDDRELTVTIVMNYVRIEIGTNVLQGKTEDIITGYISEDATKWEAIVFSSPEYEGFPTEPNELPLTQEVNFVKTTDDM